ncbi:uncharacterized protein LOC144021272 isoform X2 [Festucalex cinctus]
MPSFRMYRRLFLVGAMLAVLALPAVRGTEHLTFDNAVMANVTREGCDVTNLCLENPDNCSPVNNTGCLFTSLNADPPMSSDGFNLSVSLSGNSADLIAFGLTQNFTTSTTQLFVCGIHNESFFFQTLNRSSDGTLTPNERTTTQIRNKRTGTLIQCEFIIPNVDTSMMGETRDGTTAVVVAGDGTVNPTSGLTDTFRLLLFTEQAVNLTNAAGTVTEPAPTPTPTPIPPQTLGINREGCGNTKLCVESPDNCNPENDIPCLFASLDTTDATMDTTFNISTELVRRSSVQSTRYIAIGLTRSLSEGVTNLFICGRNSSDNSAVFLTADRNNTDNSITLVDRQVDNVRVLVDGTSTQCKFDIVGINSTASRQTVTGIRQFIVLGTGPAIQGNNIDTLSVTETSPILDITDAGANVVVIPVVSNILNISREGCGTANLCLETPDNCNPLTQPMCQFASSNFTLSSNDVFDMTVRLSGYSMGYMALGLSRSRNLSEGTSTIIACGNDTGEVFLRTFTRNNVDGTFTAINRSVSNAIVGVSSRSIECQFTINDLNAVDARETNGTIAQVFLANGTLTTGGVLDALNILLTEQLNLTSVTGEIITVAPSGNGAERNSGAMLILLSLVTLLAAFRG